MAYFGRQPKKPQQLGRIEGGRTKPGSSQEGVRVAEVRRALRVVGGERLARSGRASRAIRAARGDRAERSAR